MSDNITLVAGVLLTSVGLLALLAFVLRLGRRSRDSGVLQIDANLLPALAAAGAFMPAPEELSGVEELMAHLFSLRMTVSEITAEVLGVQDAVSGESPDAAASAPSDEDVEYAEAETPAKHAA